MVVDFAETTQDGRVMVVDAANGKTICLAAAQDGFGAVLMLSMREAICLKGLLERAIERARAVARV